MKIEFKIAFGISALVLAANIVSAVTITINKNGFADLAGGQITGTGLGSPVPLGTDASPVSFTAVAGGSYSVDFFHNSGTLGSDFSMTIDPTGTGVLTVTTGGHGGNTENIVTGFTPLSTTLTLNSKQVVLNANGSQTGVYYVYGIFPAFSIGQNSPPQTKTVIPGALSWDNLYNTGLNNEDFQIFAEDDGTVSSVPGYAEYAQFVGNKVYQRADRMHVRVESSSSSLCCIGIGYIHPLYNFQSLGFTNGVYVYEFDETVAVGNDGHYFADFGSNTITGGVVMDPTGYGFTVATPGPSRIGNTRANDYLFNPRIRYDTVLDRYYFDNIGGPGTFTYETVSGYFDNQTTPLSMTIYAWIPEPTSLSLVAMVGIGLAICRRRRN